MNLTNLSIPSLPPVDVLVVGSGSAGATAAITAARLGADVLLVERYGFMGGISTQVLDTIYGFYTPGSAARKVVGGVPDDVIQALLNAKAAIYRPNTYGAGQGITYDPNYLKITWERLALAAGVRILYHTLDRRAARRRARNRGGTGQQGRSAAPAGARSDRRLGRRRRSRPRGRAL